jgi:lipopolysaccharide/colanic/teichoic acid biosynthesis glycosyltransferase
MRRKRLFDVTVVGTAAVVWLPVVLVTAGLVLLASGRPIFYRSHRWVGIGARIKMIKFRVMVPNAHTVAAGREGDHFLNHPEDSPLYTRTGRILERWGLTELPQLFHVLNGSMSVVGSRPLTDAVNDSLRTAHGTIDHRFGTPGGLTGPPQLVGRDNLTAGERLHLEASYCVAARHGYRFRLDFLILLYTVLIVVRIKKPLTYHGALDLIHRHSATSRSTVSFPSSSSAGSVPVD